MKYEESIESKMAARVLAWFMAVLLAMTLAVDWVSR